jgi:hypothetical protein
MVKILLSSVFVYFSQRGAAFSQAGGHRIVVFWDGFNETPRSIKHFKMISFRPPAEKIHFKTYVANHSKLRLSLNILFRKACLNAAGFV